MNDSTDECPFVCIIWLCNSVCVSRYSCLQWPCKFVHLRWSPMHFKKSLQWILWNDNLPPSGQLGVPLFSRKFLKTMSVQIRTQHNFSIRNECLPFKMTKKKKMVILFGHTDAFPLKSHSVTFKLDNSGCHFSKHTWHRSRWKRWLSF